MGAMIARPGAGGSKGLNGSVLVAVMLHVTGGPTSTARGGQL